MAREPFGARLRSLRERAGLSPSELAEKVGTDEKHISRWEQSLPEPEFAIVERLAFALGMPAVELLSGRPVTWQKPTIRLTCDNFTEHLPTDFAASLVDGYTIPADGIALDDWIVTKFLVWVARESERSPDTRFEMSRHVAAVLLERLIAPR
jgi:transcriptional regulator with XRE-family HTH domain